MPREEANLLSDNLWKVEEGEISEMTTTSINLQTFRIHGVSSIIHPALLPSKLNIHRHLSQFTIPPFSLPSKKKRKSFSKAFSEELPAELVEDSKFVPLKADDPTYGPPALLLLGFELEEASKVKQLLKNLDGEFLQVIYCTEDMIGRSLWNAMNTKQPDLGNVKIAKSIPRICFLSGLTGEEMMMFIDAFPESGLEPAVFAALVPNSADKPLQEVIEEIMGDHEMMSKQSS